jgi:hypothetical protein
MVYLHFTEPMYCPASSLFDRHLRWYAHQVPQHYQWEDWLLEPSWS